MTLYSADVRKAWDIAREAHKDQTDKSGRPYIEHIEAVAEAVAHRGPTIEAVAILHDLLEDTPWTKEMLFAKGFPPDIVNAVLALTRKEGERYADFIERVARCPEAIPVKLADLAHNTDPRREWKLPATMRRRYELAIMRLLQAQEEMSR